MGDAPPLVLIGVTGGVAAYKTCEVVRRLVEAGRDVRCALTHDAERFIGPQLLAALTRKPVLDNRPVLDGTYPHLDAARDAAVVCIAPCTANTLAKLAWGLADNVVTQSALSTPAPLLIAPAMNVRMWEHPATQSNVARLLERGVAFAGPITGALAEGEQGAGRMAEPAEIVGAVEALLGRASGPLAGLRVLVTAGGTREPLDDVRFLGNRSSGRMGAALAEEAAARGAEVVTLLAHGSVRPNSGSVVEVETTADLEREALARARWADVVLMAAAVADYRPAQPQAGKHERGGAWSLVLQPTADVLAALAALRRPGQVLVGFAAESGTDVARAEAKRQRKGVDLMVLNDVSRSDIGFDVGDNEVVLVAAGGVEHVARAPKRAIAVAVLERVERLLA